MTTQNNQNRWILIGALIVLVIAAFALLIITRVDTMVNTFFNRTDQPESVAAHYYEAIRNQDYNPFMPASSIPILQVIFVAAGVLATAHTGQGETILRGEIVDQAALHGVLITVRGARKGS